MMNLHPFCRYGMACLLEYCDKENVTDVTLADIQSCIQVGLNHFSVKPVRECINEEPIRFVYSNEKNDAKVSRYLSPNVITSDMFAKNILKAALDFLTIEITGDKNQNHQDVLHKKCDIGMSQMPTSGEFASFGDTIGRGKPKATILEQGLAIIASLTVDKPCLQFVVPNKSKPELYNVCIIPDLQLDKMRLFINVFKRMYSQKCKDLLVGNVKCDNTGKKTIYKPSRPKVFRGNFPNAPYQSAMASIALLGAIGEFAKEAEESESRKALAVLEDLKDCRLYMIKYGEASVFTYNHVVVDFAKEANLNDIVKNLSQVVLYNKEKRNSSNQHDYQPFDLFASRFLQLFTKEAFKDFFAFRAEYPNSFNPLFDKYFINIENMTKEIIDSVKCLGAWLNKVAFLASKDEKEAKKEKAKILAELESTIFSAKTADALLSQVIIRAGRLSNMDAPCESTLFMEKVATGEIQLSVAKNLLTAYTRVRSYSSKEQNDESEKMESTEGNEDLSNI